MKCPVSLNINKKNDRELNNIVKKYGASSVTAISVSTITTDFDIKTTIPKTTKAINSRLIKIKPIHNAISYRFSGTDFTTDGYLSASTGVTALEMSRINSMASPEYLIKAEKFFNSKGKIISPTRGNNNRLVIEGQSTSLRNNDTRTFIRISEADKRAIYNKIVKDRGNIQNKDRKNLYDYSKTMEAIVLSGLYRGFDIIFDGPFSTQVVNKAIEKFNKLLNQNSSQVLYVSEFQGEGAIKTKDISSFITSLDNKNAAISLPNTYSGNGILDTFLTADERSMMGRFKRASNADKRVVIGKMATVFNRYMPGVETSLLSSYEIENLYGRSFATKKGFIINNTVVLNIDELDASTAFHEFGHYYLAWLRTYNKREFDRLMTFTANRYSKDFEFYKKTYNSTGLTFTDNDILEEIFVKELGMIGAKELNNSLDKEQIENNTLIKGKDAEESVEVFMDRFMEALIRSSKVSRADVKFTMYSNISQLLDISGLDTASGNLMSDLDGDMLMSMKSFFIEDYSAEEIFDGLISRGLIKRVGKDHIILKDILGNTMDADGNYPKSTVTYRYVIGDKSTDIKRKAALVKQLMGYLQTNKNYATVRYAIDHEPVSVVKTIRDNVSQLKLNETINKYVNKKGTEFNRVTEYLQKQFTGNLDAERYIIISMYNDAKKRYKDVASDDMTRLEKDIEARKTAEEFMSNPETESYKAYYKEKKELFEFKTYEGTYLHTVAELYVRAMNYSTSIDYGKENKGKLDWRHFLSHIREAMTNTDRDAFAIYFDKFFFSKLKGQEGTKEYQDFKAAYDFILENMTTEDTGRARELLLLINNMLRDEVYGKLKGPLTLMPEVKLSSESLGIAGTIDLLVVDGNGRAHIFDYKTKETGKEKNWDYPNPVPLTKELSGYRENAMMKASIQTSIYKLMLLEMGIDVGPANVFYIESLIDRNVDVDTALGDPIKMRYIPQRIIKKSLIDVSGELVNHFGKTRTLPEIFTATKDSTDIEVFTQLVSGGVSLDKIQNIDKAVDSIYQRALRNSQSIRDPELQKLLALMEGEKEVSTKDFVIKLWGGSEHVIDSSLQTEEERKAEIKRLIVERHDIKSVEARLETLFYDPSSQGFGVRDQILKGLLKGTSSGSHEFIKLSSILNLGVDFSGFDILKDKITNEHRLVILNHDDSRNIPFGQKHHNIFGNYITNNIAKAKYPTINWSNTNYNMRLVKAGLMMARMRQVDPDFKISMVVANDSLKSGKTIPRLIDVSTILFVTKAMIELANEADPGSVPKDILAMLEDEKLFESKTYIPNPFDALAEFLSSSILDVQNVDDVFTNNKTAVERAMAVKDALANLDARQDYEELMPRLHDFRTSLYQRLGTEDQRINNPVLALTDNVIMYIMGFNHTVSPFNTTFIQNFLVTTSKAANTYSAAFNRKIFQGSTNIREDFNAYKKIHNKLIEKLALDKGVNIHGLEAVMLKRSMKEIYENLFTTDNTDRKNAFILKSPNASNLSPVEREYLRFLKSTFQDYADLSSFTQVLIPDQWMPLMPKSKSGLEQDRDTLDKAKDSAKVFNLDQNYHSEDEDTIDSEFSVESRFKSQMPKKHDTIDVNFTDARKLILGINDQGDTLPNSADRPLTKIEDNLENVLDTYVIASLEAHYYRDVTSFGRSLFYNVKRFEKLSGLTYSNLIETLTLIQRRVINHKESDSSNKAIKILNKFTTNAAIAGTVNQFLLEAFTNPMVTSANYLGDKLYGVMFDGQREFSLKSYSTAAAIVWNPGHQHHEMVNELDKLYGITSSDTRALKEMLNKLEKNSMWQTKHLMYMNKLMMEIWQKITLTAYMIEQGSFYAHSLDSEGNLLYDEKKDKRFFDSTATKEEQLTKKKVYEATKKELALHRNGLTGEAGDDWDSRKLRKAWTTYDSNYIKELIVELYSSMDESSKSLATYYTHMSFLAKMRTWIFAKIPRYFQKPMTAEENQSASRLVRVNDPDAEGGFRMEYKGTPTEGVLFTVESMARQLAEYKLEVFKKGSLNEHQKKNLSKLLADMIVFSVMAAGAAGLFAAIFDDDDEKSELAKLVYQRWMMATGDVFLLKSMLDMTTGNSSMFISVSVGFRLLNAITRASLVSTQALYDPDVTIDDALRATNNVLRNSAGVYRTLEMGYDAVVIEE